MSRQRTRARSRAEAQREAARRRRPVSDSLVMEAIDKDGVRQSFPFPKDKLLVIVNQLPALQAKGFRDIRITNAA